MKLIGFGCSFTYGSELLTPELEHILHQKLENIKYRECNTRDLCRVVQ